MSTSKAAHSPCVGLTSDVSPGKDQLIPRQWWRRSLALALPWLSLLTSPAPPALAWPEPLRGANIAVIGAAPSRIPRSVTAGAKCDRLDCIKLADYAARGMLKPITIPTPEEESRRSLLRRHYNLVDAIRRVKQRIKSQLLFLGLPEPDAVKHWSNEAVDALLRLPVDQAARLVMESYLRELTFQQTELRNVERQLQQLLMETKEERRRVVNLRTVPGVGPTVATTFAMELYRPQGFQRAEEVASYLGLAPMVRHSGGKTPAGRLIPVGQKRLRSLLIEADWVWKAKDASAAELYNRLRPYRSCTESNCSSGPPPGHHPLANNCGPSIWYRIGTWRSKAPIRKGILSKGLTGRSFNEHY